MLDFQSLQYAIASSLPEPYITNVHGLLLCVIHILLFEHPKWETGRSGGVKECTDTVHSLTAARWLSDKEWSFQIPKHLFGTAHFVNSEPILHSPYMSSCWKPTLSAMTIVSSTVTELPLHGMQGDASQQSHVQPGSGCSAQPTLRKQPCSDSRGKTPAQIRQTKARKAKKFALLYM